MVIEAGVSMMPSGEPELPRVYVDTTFYAPTGDTHHVASGGDLQAAINAAALGDVITLEAGATFTGSFTLPDKGAGTDYLVIRTDTTDQNFVAAGTRVGPSDASLMAKIIALKGNAPPISADASAHHYRLLGLEITVDGYNSTGTSLIEIYNGSASVSTLIHHIVIDRCYLHGHSTEGIRRGVALNGRDVGIVDSYISKCMEVGADSQAIGGWAGPGPYRISNNYLEGAAENVMFGGSDPSIENLVPSDIEIIGNHLFKPYTWKADDPSYAGTLWQVKNIFELKNARRVLFEGNLLEHNWAQAQNGFSILLTPRNQDDTAPWSVVEDVTIKNNVMRNVTAGINILGWDYTHPSQRTSRIAIRNNLLIDLGLTALQLLDGEASGSKDVVFEHNTIDHAGWMIFCDGGPNQGFVFRDNVAACIYGLGGTGTPQPDQTITTFLPDAVFAGNALWAISTPQYESLYPSGNFFPDTIDDVGFVDHDAGDYRIDSGSPYKDLGIDKTALDTAMGDMAQTYW